MPRSILDDLNHMTSVGRSTSNRRVPLVLQLNRYSASKYFENKQSLQQDLV